MALSKEELLKPRIKIIAPWPGMECQVGDIINIPSPDWVYSKKEHCDADYFMYWPHLFRKLEWHENRKPEDMPEYVKWKSRGEIVKVKNWAFNVFWTCEGVDSPHSWMQDEVAPASEEEYNQYIKQQSNQ